MSLHSSTWEERRFCPVFSSEMCLLPTYGVCPLFFHYSDSFAVCCCGGVEGMRG